MRRPALSSLLAPPKLPLLATILCATPSGVAGCQAAEDTADASTEASTDASTGDTTGDPLDIPEPAECDVVAQNQFVLDTMRVYYMWNHTIPDDIDVTAYASPEALVSELRANNENDHWSRISEIASSDALYMEGKYIGTGVRIIRDDEDNAWIATVLGGSPGSLVGLMRGDQLLAVNGISIAELDETNGWSAAFGETLPGVEIEFQVQKQDQSIETVVVVKDWITLTTVPIVQVLDGPNGSKVGYYMLEKLVETTMDELEAAFEQFKAAGVDKLIIDARYSSGGLLNVAGRNTSLSLGAAHAGEVSYVYLYNDDLSDQNKTAYIEARDNSIGAEQIVVLTGAATLSATELLINALEPYAEVTLIGTDTGGKPYGMKGFEFCEKRLYPVTYRMANADGLTDYVDGLPADCYALDDVHHQLGDVEEGMLAAALAYLGDGSCMSPPPMPSPSAPWQLRPREGLDEVASLVIE